MHFIKFLYQLIVWHEVHFVLVAVIRRQTLLMPLQLSLSLCVAVS